MGFALLVLQFAGIVLGFYALDWVGKVFFRSRLVGMLRARGVRCKKSPKTHALEFCSGLSLRPRAFLRFFHRTPALPKLSSGIGALLDTRYRSTKSANQWFYSFAMREIDFERFQNIFRTD